METFYERLDPADTTGNLRRNERGVLQDMNMPNIENLNGDHLTRELLDVIPPNATIVNNDTLFTIYDLGSNRLSLQSLVQYLRLQPVGTRTLRPLYGYTIGQLVHAMRTMEYDLHGYYLSGTVVNVQTIVPPTGDVQTRAARSVEIMSILEFPLWRIFIARSLWGRTIQQLNDIELLDYLEQARRAEGGSEINFYLLWENCTIKRRHGYPLYMELKVYTLATGGFSQLMTESLLQPFVYQGRLSRGLSVPVNFHGSLYIPSGDGNCVQSCVRYLYSHRYDAVSDREASTVEGEPDHPFNLRTKEEWERMDEEYVDDVFELFKEEKVKVLLKTNKYRKMKCDSKSKLLKAQKHYQKVIRGGYSNSFLRDLIKFFDEHSCMALHIFYLFYDASHSQPYRVRDRGEILKLKTNLRRTHIFMFQMRLDGSIYSNKEGVVIHSIGSNNTAFETDAQEEKAAESTKTFLGFLHMVGLVVPNEYEMEDKWMKLLMTKGSRLSAVNFVNWMSEKYLVPYMKKVLDAVNYDEHIDEEKIMKAVEYQKKRCDLGQVSTLMFDDHGKNSGVLSDDPNLSADLRLRRHKQAAKSARCAVVAYDYETVTLTKDCIGQIRHEFRRTSASVEEMGKEYGPVECEVPFSAQWVPVNVSFRGRMFQRAHQAGTRVETYDWDRELDAANQFISAQDIGNGATNSMRISDVMLKKVETCYGNKVLGECIEEMMTRIALWGHTNGFSIVYCYAHNGCGFDGYISLRYCSFEIVNILKTPRGLLMLDYKVPIARGADGKEMVVILRFRDTRVWLAGNLKKIAASFKCPKVWQKIDFPITLLTHKNCYNPEIMAISRDYGENDVKALAWIIRELNWVIGEDIFDPASPYKIKPAIAQFVTVMGMVKQVTSNVFRKEFKLLPLTRPLPCAIDIPLLRNWLKKATIGGRVEAYARTYISPYFNSIISAWDKQDVDMLKQLHKKMVDQDACDMVLDVTSLYPTAQSLCPMPTGKLYSCSIEQCQAAINIIGCNECSKGCKLCPQHRNDARNNNPVFVGGPTQQSRSNPSPPTPLRPFVIVLVRNVHYCHSLSSTSNSREFQLYPFCARKLENGRGLVYTFETNQNLHTRKKKSDVILEVQSYTNIDLYWMSYMGWAYEILGGFGWETSDTYMNFLLESFNVRKQAKEAGNVVMSEFKKLQINGAYGVTAQGDIEDGSFLATLPDELKELNPLDGRVSQFLHTKRRSQLHHSEYIKEGTSLPNGQTFFQKAKAEGIAEYFSAISPMQIGAAVLAWSRHIVNLIIMQPAVRPMKYTDTDSISVPNNVVKFLERQCPGVIDHSKTAPLGTLKNDHAETCGDEARVFFSVYATKKVKMHFVLAANGKFSICTTFKGLNPNMLTPDGLRYHDDRYEYAVAKTLLDLMYNGKADNVEVTSWKRTMAGGIEINDHLQHFANATYLDRSKGTIFEKHRGNGITEMFVPFGSPVEPRFEFYDLNTTPSPVSSSKLKDMIILNNDERKRGLTRLMGGRDQTKMVEFLQRFYKDRDTYHLFADNNDYKQLCDKILASQ